MPHDNRISAEITPADKATILAKLAEITALLPFLVNLSKEERIALPKLGPASLAFDEQCATYMASAPSLVPAYVIPAEVAKDRALRRVLGDILRPMRQLAEKIDDTQLLVGNEVWMADLSYYQSARQGARRDVPGADTVYDDLRARFPGLAGDEEPENPTPPPPPPP